MLQRGTDGQGTSSRHHLVDPGTEAVLAVKDSATAATRSADDISRQRRGKTVAIWVLDRALRPGATITDAGAGAVFVAEIGNGRWSRS